MPKTVISKTKSSLKLHSISLIIGLGDQKYLFMYYVELASYQKNELAAESIKKPKEKRELE